ncbi:putative acyltransferase-like protein [Eutypa lata UCREL1]|uniref:Putative acyltransferase-like protein n=1 Tax=Eutypa lata (strain UCR-EL1) TaxID=1287681 RepID=M7SYX9_EUTLA|nr:putative acyltransferase-like protein [Eutypa lata UCREL1]
MEKYSQFRDRGSGISPFIPTSTPTSTFYTFARFFVFLFRLPIFLGYCAVYFLLLAQLPLPLAFRKLLLWGMLGIPGIWWVDLQLDGVKRGSLSQQPPSRVPHPRSVIAAQFTSPVDALYLAAIFDPIFTISYPRTRKVQRISLFRALTLALSSPAIEPPPGARLTTLRALVEQNPHRVVAVFPEMSTTNGKGILPFSPSLLSAPAGAEIFPVSMRYTPPDITTPVPGAYVPFLWNLLSRPTHCIRVRIAEAVANTSASGSMVNGVSGEADDGYAQHEDDLTPDEKRVIDHVGEDLARLARNKRVGLTLRDKAAFINAWKKGRK